MEKCLKGIILTDITQDFSHLITFGIKRLLPSTLFLVPQLAFIETSQFFHLLLNVISQIIDLLVNKYLVARTIG